jgi:acyl-[acyl-carrier-protein]-phospholipid O-acyltransferase/long-chain-fatty-acid--[acyl-carrier-protein] ligase
MTCRPVVPTLARASPRNQPFARFWVASCESRAKIGGEMVSMTAAESLVSSQWPRDVHAVLSLPDARKGEQLVLLTSHAGAGLPALLAHARARGVPEIMVPRTILTVASLPLLGSGKVDYPAAQRLLEATRAGERVMVA